jgi:uncharacterized OB-fold protein
MNGTEETGDMPLLVGHNEGGPYLIGSKCVSCEAVFFPRQSICPRCTGREILQTPLSRKGRLYTFTEVYQKPPDYDGPVPYMIGRVQLPEGVFVLAQLAARKEDLRIDLPMELLVEMTCPNESEARGFCYKFRPAESGSEKE